MSELDVLLRESLGRLAEPGDPTGVLEAIRARVEAAGPLGDGGSGAGGLGSGGWGAAPWAGPALLGAVALVSAAAGVGLALTLPGPAEPEAPTPVVIRTESGVGAAACPGGPAITTLDPGARVLALARSEDGAFLAVRDPASLGTTVWVRAADAAVDSGQDVAALPVQSCEEGTAIPVDDAVDPTPDDTVAPPPDDDPAPQPPAPQPPADTTPPTIQVGGWSELYICTTDSGYGPMSAQISITVGDNVGVTAVSGSSASPGVSVSGPSGSGAVRTFTVSRSGLTDAYITVSFSVSDAAGNSIGGTSPALDTVGPGNCLI